MPLETFNSQEWTLLEMGQNALAFRAEQDRKKAGNPEMQAGFARQAEKYRELAMRCRKNADALR